MVATGDISDQFLHIHNRALALGLKSKDLVSTSSMQSVQSYGKSRVWLRVNKFLQLLPLIISTLCFILVLLLAGVLIYVRYFGGLEATLRFWVEDLEDGILPEEKCLVELHESVKEILRPPVACHFCVNVTSVDIVSKLSRTSFEEYYAYSGRPVIIVDAMDDWSAVDTFSFDYFKSLYASNSPALSDSSGNEDCQFFPYKTEFNNLSEVLSMSPERFAEPWYIGWSNCDAKVANVLREHYRKPYFLPEVSESSKLDWIFMGRPGYGAYMHIDSVDNPSWQAQIKGTKKWSLEPPPECYFQCPVVRIDITVQPGQIIVLDTNVWYHMTEVVGPDISIVIGSEYD